MQVFSNKESGPGSENSSTMPVVSLRAGGLAAYWRPRSLCCAPPPPSCPVTDWKQAHLAQSCAASTQTGLDTASWGISACGIPSPLCGSKAFLQSPTLPSPRPSLPTTPCCTVVFQPWNSARRKTGWRLLGWKVKLHASEELCSLSL